MQAGMQEKVAERFLLLLLCWKLNTSYPNYTMGDNVPYTCLEQGDWEFDTLDKIWWKNKIRLENLYVVLQTRWMAILGKCKDWGSIKLPSRSLQLSTRSLQLMNGRTGGSWMRQLLEECGSLTSKHQTSEHYNLSFVADDKIHTSLYI